jgi:hypothetical protein
MAKLNVKFTKPTASTFRSWFFVLVAGGLLAIVAVIDRGGLAELRATADGSTGCQMEVSVDELNVRADPSQSATPVQTLTRGTRVDATRNVVAGFRELEGGRWASNQYLTPLPSSNCG